MENKAVLVVFTGELPVKSREWWSQFGALVAPGKFEMTAREYGLFFKNVDELIEPGSIYEGSTLAEEISRLKLPDGKRIAKSFTYEGYELWWISYTSLFIQFCLPYTQYRKLLEYLRDFRKVFFYQPPFKSLFSCYLEAYGRDVRVIKSPGLRGPSFLPLGVLFQIIITIACMPFLAVRKYRLMVFIGDKFEKTRDYDFRMKFIYEELRQKKIPFVEFIRSLQSWKTLLEHVFTRKRFVVYSEAVAFAGKFMSILTGGRALARRKFGAYIFDKERNPEARFKLLVSTQYLLTVYDDVWAIRIMKFILRAIGVRAAFIPASAERNFHAVLGCKLNGIPTVGIMHGVQLRHYNVYDFLPGFDGNKMLSVDKFGVWSDWWKEYYLKKGRAYRPEQIYVSGPMRPLVKGSTEESLPERPKDKINVLFVSEEMAVPREVLPYLYELLEHKDIELTIKFRPTRDGFEDWLIKNEPDILKRKNLKVVKGSMQDAIINTDVAVGCQSTGVLEALLQLKVPIYFRTRKWGDYYSLKEYDTKQTFFAESPEELIEKIRSIRAVPAEALKDLRERYFGDPYENGSKWVVQELERYIK